MDTSLDNKLKPFLIGNAIPISADPLSTNHGTWQAEEIVYYRLKLDLSSPADGIIQFDFGVSGKVDGPAKAGGMTIKNFLRSVQAGKPAVTRGLTKQYEFSPHVRLVVPCYVVIQLDPVSNVDWYFMPGVQAVGTEDDHTSDYLELRHIRKADAQIDNPELIAPGALRQDPGADKCQLIYFAAWSPQWTSNNGGRNDRFNLYTQVGNGPGGVVPLIVDPDIKNNGGDPD